MEEDGTGPNAMGVHLTTTDPCLRCISHVNDRVTVTPRRLLPLSSLSSGLIFAAAPVVKNILFQLMMIAIRAQSFRLPARTTHIRC
jgi:hypothetical protein